MSVIREPTSTASGRVRYNHSDLEEKVWETFNKTPDHAIANAKGISGPKLFSSLVTWGDPNTLASRVKRLNDEQLVVSYSDFHDKSITAASILGGLLTAFILIYAFFIGSHQEFVADSSTSDHSKIAKFNKFWMGWPWFCIRTFLSVMPFLIVGWRAFKRSTKVRDQSNVLAALGAQLTSKGIKLEFSDSSQGSQERQ